MNTPSSHPPKNKHRMRFDMRELAGSLGDMGTFLPLTVALALATGLDLAWMLVAAGLMNIASGVLFRIPIPVQPMKAIAAVAITQKLSGGAVVASGWIMGGLLTLIAVFGLMAWIDRLVPRPVVRAIQLGVGLKLCQSGWERIEPLTMNGVDSLIMAAGIGVVLCVGILRRWPIVLPVFVVGFGILAVEHAQAYTAVALAWPTLLWITPTSADWSIGTIKGALPQLPLTLLNSVIAVCALTRDYYPDRAITPRRMALSVGMMNLLCVGWSGMPMCHGSGGLAAQHRAGARTGGSVVMLGIAKVLIGIALGASLMPLLLHYPAAVLGPLIVFAGVSIAYAGIQTTRGRDWLTVLPAAAIILMTNMLYGFMAGVLLFILLQYLGNNPRYAE